MTSRRLRKTVGRDTTIITVTPIGDKQWRAIATVNGRKADEELLTFTSKAERDATMAQKIAFLKSHGYQQQ